MFYRISNTTRPFDFPLAGQTEPPRIIEADPFIEIPSGNFLFEVLTTNDDPGVAITLNIFARRPYSYRNKGRGSLTYCGTISSASELQNYIEDEFESVFGPPYQNEYIEIAFQWCFYGFRESSKTFFLCRVDSHV